MLFRSDDEAPYYILAFLEIIILSHVGVILLHSVAATYQKAFEGVEH